MITWSTNKSGSWVMGEIAKTGSNCVRLMVTSDYTSSDMNLAIQNAVNSGMIVMPVHAGAAGDLSKLQTCIDYWKKSDVKNVIESTSNKKWVLLNIANEAGDGNVTQSQFETAYKNAITQLRNAGYTVPFVIDAPGWGQNYTIALNAWQTLNNHDPLHKVIVSAHTYWNGTDQQRKDHYNTIINKVLSDNITFVFGEGPTPSAWDCTVSPYDWALTTLHANNMNWLAWSWGLVNNGDCSNPVRYDVTTNGYYGSWETSAGREIMVDHVASVKSTSRRPCSIANAGSNCITAGNDDLVSIEAPTSVTPGSTSTITVSYAASTQRDVYVNFQLDSSPWTSYVAVKADVSSGSGTININVPIPANVPVLNDAYQFQVFLTTDGGGWNEKIKNLAKTDVDCVNNSGTIVVLARGNCGGEKIELRVDNTVAATFTLTSSLANYTYSGYSGFHTINVAFINDQNNGCDYNIMVDYVDVCGSIYQTSSSATRTGCGDTSTEWLWCGGNFDYGIKGCGSASGRMASLGGHLAGASAEGILQDPEFNVSIYPNPSSVQNDLIVQIIGFKTETRLSVVDTNGILRYATQTGESKVVVPVKQWARQECTS